jgi:addiction module HigA family antidote
MIRREDLHKIDLSDVVADDPPYNATPGEILKHEFLIPMGLSARCLARDLGVPANRITEIVNGTRTITAETALLLARRFGTTPELWMNLQTAWSLEEARRKMPAPV